MTGTVGSQSHLAYRALEQQIVTLKLKPGALVNERQLIDVSGFGRTPVREAIQKLEWQGLVLVRPRVGLQIAEIHPGDHAAIMAVRLKLEPLLARLAAEHATEPLRLDLLDCAQAMTAAAAAGSFDTFLSADKAFDEILEEACPNPFLVSAVAPLQSHSRRMWYAAATVSKMERSVSLHVAVIGAIRQGEGDAAEHAMAELLAYLNDG